MSILVVSAPYEDYHATWAIDSKDIDHVTSLFDSNGWTNYIDDFDPEEVFKDVFLEKMSVRNGSAPEKFDDVVKYFQLLVDDNDVTLKMFSDDLIHCVSNDRGSWSSYCWVE